MKGEVTPKPINPQTPDMPSDSSPSTSSTPTNPNIIGPSEGGQSGFTIVEVVIVVLVIATVGLVGLSAWRSRHNKNSGNNVSVTSSSSSSTSGKTTDVYAGWQTFKSSIGGFSVKYPSSWNVTEQAGGGFQIDTVTGSSNTSVDLLSGVPSTPTNNFDLNFTIIPQAVNVTAPDGVKTSYASLSSGFKLLVEQDTSNNIASFSLIQSQANQSIILLKNGQYLQVTGQFMGYYGSATTGSYNTNLSLSKQISSQQWKDAVNIVGSLKN